MRGGLGRTLLTAFLIMAILPLSAVSWYATDRSRANIQEQIVEKLASVSAFDEALMLRWLEEQWTRLSGIGCRTRIEPIVSAAQRDPAQARALLATLAREIGAASLALVGPDGQIIAASETGWESQPVPLADESDPDQAARAVQTSLGPSPGAGLTLVNRLDCDTRTYLAARVPTTELVDTLEETSGLGQTGRVYLVDRAGMALPSGQQLIAPPIEAALAGQEFAGPYISYDGMPVIGIYRWIPALQAALFVEQSQEEAHAGNDAVTTAVIAATLAAALVTAIIAAFVTRQITRRVVALSESVLCISAGDLSSRALVTGRDEIAILGRVFNRMAAELEALYSQLEAKVAQRTELLQQANYQIQRRAIQMHASLEVGQAATSVLDPDQMLDQVVRVLRDRFVYSYVAVYTKDSEDDLLLRASVGDPSPFHGDHVSTDLPGPLGQAYWDQVAVAENHSVAVAVGPPTAYTRSEVALPMRVGDRILGVLDVQTTGQEGFDQDEISVLQNVSNQISIALENARAYALEHEAAKQLRELDRSKRHFLTNMSHELRTPLTNILGFSRLLLKGVNGPLSDQQRKDLEIIYHNGEHLVGLINDLLDVSQIEAGLMELQLREVNLGELIGSVMATASALVRGREVALREEIATGLPIVRADPTRIRQVLLRLLANAAKCTDRGSISVRAWPCNGQVLVSVRDTGSGIAAQEQEGIFDRFEQGALGNRHRPNDAGLGLALSREFLEMHGGRIWVESELGKGATFTFSLPVNPAQGDTPDWCALRLRSAEVSDDDSDCGLEQQGRSGKDDDMPLAGR
jgi:signal transduction histidine kinase/HAMP domain-containing protein